MMSKYARLIVKSFLPTGGKVLVYEYCQGSDTGAIPCESILLEPQKSDAYENSVEVKNDLK